MSGGYFYSLPPKAGACGASSIATVAPRSFSRSALTPTCCSKRAREKRDEARSLVADGTDPAEIRKAEKAARGNTFAAIAEEWLRLRSDKLAAYHARESAAALLGFLLRDLGTKPIATITAAQLLAALRRIEARGAARDRAPRVQRNRWQDLPVRGRYRAWPT